MKKIYLLICLIFSLMSISAQIDDLFWFAAPDITSGHEHNPMTFCFASFANPATVTISQPSNPSFTPVTVNLNPYSYYSLDVTNQENIVETAPHNTVCNYGFKIVSTEKITVYYQLGANNSEIYTLKGRNALGTHFIVPMQNYLNTGNFSPSAYSSVEIVATENNTTVTITPSQELLGGLPANVPFSITLNQGQSYCIKSSSRNAAAHLTNTVITSDKPIAVNSSDDSAESNSFSGYSGQDLVGEQIVPIEYAGTMFVALRNNRAFEGITVSPTQNGTNVYINGNTTPAATLNMGDSYTYMVSQSPTIATMITTDKPAFVFQLTGSDGECGGTVLPGIGCTGSSEIVYARPSYSTNLKLSVLVHTSDVGGFTMNNSTSMLTAADFTVLPYDPTWSYAYKDFSSSVPNQSVMRISNSQGLFHLGVMDYYSGMSSSLGYFSAYNSNGTIEFAMTDKYCAHDSVRFSYITREIDTVWLIKPNGDTLKQEPYLLTDVSIADTGSYVVYAHSITGCDNTWVMDTINIQIIQAPKPDLGPDIELCHGEIVELQANYPDPNAHLVWSTGDTTDNTVVLTEGDYVLNVSISQGTVAACENSDTVRVIYHAQPKVDFEAETTGGCAPMTIQFQNLTQSEDTALSYVWTFFNENGEVISYTSEHNPVVDFPQPGSYSVQLWAISEHGCVDSLLKEHYINVHIQPEVDFTMDPEVVFLSEDGGQVHFTSFCSADLTGTEGLNFVWDFGDGNEETADINPTHNYTSWNDYVVTLTVNSEHGCGAEISHIVIVEEELVFPNVITPNGDGMNDFFTVENLNTNINAEDPDEYRSNELFIYNRWGKLVFHTKNYDSYAKNGECFMGTNPFTGDDLPDGVYYYTFYYKGHYKETKYNGSLTIIR